MGLKRLVTAALIVPPFYLYVTKLPPVFFAALLLAAAYIAQTEFYNMYGVRGGLRAAGVVWGVAVLGLMFALPGRVVDALAGGLLVAALLRLFLKRSPGSALAELSPAVMGVLYVPLLLSYQLALRQAGARWIIFLFAAIWIADSFAYYVGKNLGRRKLYEPVSPNKTVAGAVGSLAGGAAGGALVKVLLMGDVSLAASALLGLVLGAVAVCGDLVESMFKRDAGVKDSSGLIPGGHGGLLDKLDGVLFGGPALLWMVKALRIAAF
ncbi:MAG: phosphatidate cytidylyltransferase [Thermodesulfovibrionales bacterium]